MKLLKTTGFFLLLFLAAEVGTLIAQNAIGRFSHLETNEQFPHDSYIRRVETYHDTTTGDEIACFFGSDGTSEGYYSLSCLKTGRHW